MKLVLVISLLFLSFFGISQNLTWNFFGKLTNNDTKKMEAGVTISVICNGKTLGSSVSASNGKYDVRAEAPIGSTVFVVFSKPGFVSKKVEVTSKNMNVEDLIPGEEIPMEMPGSIFAERSNVDFSFLNNEPVALFAWDVSQHTMVVSNTDAIVKTRKKIEDLLAAQPVATGPSPDDLKYNEAIKSGEALFNQKNTRKLWPNMKKRR